MATADALLQIEKYGLLSTEATLTIVNIDRVIKSLPTRPDEHEDEGWQKESYCAQLITQVRARQESESSFRID